jgi:hypothetical protein
MMILFPTSIRFPHAFILIPLLLSMPSMLTSAGGRPGVPLNREPQHAFIENRGQVRDTEGRQRDDILYYAEFPSLTVYVRTTGISYVFTDVVRRTNDDATSHANPLPDCGPRSDIDALRSFRTDLDFLRTSTMPRIEAEEYAGAPDAFVHGAVSLRPSTWRRLYYRDAYPGIDMMLYFANGQLKYDFILQPGARCSDIAMRVNGADSVRIEADGSLRIVTPLGCISDRAPMAYQTAGTASVNDLREPVPARFHLQNHEVGFRVDAPNPSSTLTIDPAIEWSTYTGGFMADVGVAVATDAMGNVIVTGWTVSPNFPVTAGALQTTKGGIEDAFVAKFGPAGSRVWTTFFGGSRLDIGTSVKANAASEIFVCGLTESDSVFIQGTPLQTYHGKRDGFLAKFLPDGQIAWFTYIGGSDLDECHNIAISPNGAIHLTGRTASMDFPTTFGAFQFMNAGSGDAFVMKLTPAGDPIWATCLGGKEEDWGHSIAVDRDSMLVLSGHTHSFKFPVTNDAMQKSWSGYRDGFAARFSSTGKLLYSTYLGSDNWDDAYAIDCDRDKNFFVTGCTDSKSFTGTPGAFQPAVKDSLDAFVVKFDSAGVRQWATLCGGSRKDIAYGIVAFPSGNVAITGGTRSTDFPISPDAVQKVNGGNSDAFLVKFSKSGSRIFGTYLGGAYDENHESYQDVSSVTVDRKGSMILTGWTASSDFPVVNPVQSNLGGSWDVILTKFECPLTPPATVTPSGVTSFCEGGSVRLDAGAGYAFYQWSTGDTSRTITVSISGKYSVFVTDTNDCADQSQDVDVTVFPLPKPLITPLGATTFCEGDSVVLDAGVWNSALWSTGASGRYLTVKGPGPVRVHVKDTNGCEADSPALDIIVQRRPAPVITALGPTTFCDGDSVTLNAGSGFKTYRWTTGDTTATLVVKATGTYGVVVTNMFDCDAAATPVRVTVNPKPAAVITASGPLVFCAGDSVVLDAGAGSKTYGWSTGEATRTITVRTSGTFSVTVVNSFDCIASSAPVTVTVHPTPQPVITPLGSTSFCEGDSVVLDAGAGFARYRWSNGDTTRTTVARNSAAYSVVASYATGCSAVSPMVTVVVFPKPVPAITASGPLSFCDGDSVVLSAPPGFPQYAWSSGQVTQSITVKTSGVFSVAVTDANTCRGTSAQVAVTVNPTPAVPVIRQSRDTLISSPEYRYQWLLNGAPLVNDTAQRMLIPRSGVYTVTVTNAFGCSATSLPLSVSIAMTTVELPVIEAAPGQRVTIPLRLTSSQWLASSGATSFVSKIRFSKSLLLPLASTAQWTVSGSDRIGVFQGHWTDTVGVLASMECLAMLGDADTTTLWIDEFGWTAGAVRVTKINGLFRLIVCREGGPRLFDGSVRVALMQNSPNPFNATTVVEFQVEEPGRARIIVSDMLGREVATLYDKDVEPGRYTAAFDASALPSGRYLYTLRSGTRAITRMMVLMK